MVSGNSRQGDVAAHSQDIHSRNHINQHCQAPFSAAQALLPSFEGKVSLASVSCTPPVGITAGCAAYSRQTATATVGLSAWRALRGLRAMLRASLVRASAQTSHSLCCTCLPAQFTANLRLDAKHRQVCAHTCRTTKSRQAHAITCTCVHPKRSPCCATWQLSSGGKASYADAWTLVTIPTHLL